MAPSALDRVIRKIVDEDDEESSEDFDRRVADLIVAEAKQKNQGRFSSSSSHEQSPRRHATNTRFLTNVVRGVHSHNRAVLSISPAGEVEQRRDRKQTSRGSLRDVYDQNSQGESSEQVREGRMRGWSDEEDGREKRERDPTSRHEENDDRRDRRSHRYQSSSRVVEEQEYDRRSRRSRVPDYRRKRSHSPHRHRRESDRTTIGETLPSKMDRYFDEKYDPVLDVRAETREDENGLIEDDGWDRMLRALREKEERKRARKEDRKEDKKAHRREVIEANKVGTDVMQMQYTSQGKQREWDKGKDVVD